MNKGEPMRYLFIMLLFVGCQKEKFYCAEGLHQPDGLHLYYSEIEEAKTQVIPFDPPIEYEFYVVTLSKCSLGFCIENYELGDLRFTGGTYILNNGCHTK
ncbi:hypothetical protein [Gracilimonas sp.]|uniref:hypothetical protein n=1 Tax=Gracilimonas sp. TaxID=1974203 RepID=UPI00287101B0|nr:hypothetical protein [Gracilimonas sp.]